MSGFVLSALGIVSPLGRGKAATARALFAGTKVVQGGGIDDPLPPSSWTEGDCRNNRLMQVALDEIADAVAAARVRYGAARIAVVLGTSTSGVAEADLALEAFDRDGRWPAGFNYRQQELGGLAEHAARHLGLTGPAYTVSTACSSSAKVFASARRLIRAGVVDAAVVGGADTLCRLTRGGFGVLTALSPSGRCVPFSANRDGIVIGEGAAAFLLERGGAGVQLLGLGETSDAHHISAPQPDGDGARAAMWAALDDAGLAPGDIAYVNLHGTATPLNDPMEALAVASVFGTTVPVSSTKAMTGHLLGAAGGCEAGFLWLALSPEHNPDGNLPPHLWDGAAMAGVPALNLAAARLPAQERLAMLSDSFAFGGSNAAVVLGRGWPA